MLMTTKMSRGLRITKMMDDRKSRNYAAGPSRSELMKCPLSRSIFTRSTSYVAGGQAVGAILGGKPGQNRSQVERLRPGRLEEARQTPPKEGLESKARGAWGPDALWWVLPPASGLVNLQVRR